MNTEELVSLLEEYKYTVPDGMKRTLKVELKFHNGDMPSDIIPIDGVAVHSDGSIVLQVDMDRYYYENFAKKTCETEKT